MLCVCVSSKTCSEVGLACRNMFIGLIYMHDDDVTSRLVPMYLYWGQEADFQQSEYVQVLRSAEGWFTFYNHQGGAKELPTITIKLWHVWFVTQACQVNMSICMDSKWMSSALQLKFVLSSMNACEIHWTLADHFNMWHLELSQSH